MDIGGNVDDTHHHTSLQFFLHYLTHVLELGSKMCVLMRHTSSSIFSLLHFSFYIDTAGDRQECV